MQLKNDQVKPNISTPLLLGLIVADQVYEEESVDLVITSLNDGVHSETSLHYSGNGADLRIWNLANPENTVKKIKNRLNKHYDVILEKDHIHLEYQPRG